MPGSAPTPSAVSPPARRTPPPAPVSLRHLRDPARTSVQAQALARPAARKPGWVWARSAGSSFRTSTAVSTCRRGDLGSAEGRGGFWGSGWGLAGTDLRVRAQRHVVVAKVASVLPVEPYGLQEGTGGGVLASL